MVTVLSVEATGSWVGAARWIALTALFCAAIPYVVLVALVRMGRIHDRQVVRREERRGPVGAAAVSMLFGLLVLSWLGAPRGVIGYVVALLVSMALLLALTPWTKASFHEAGVVGPGAGLALLHGGWWWAGGVAVAGLVGWARVRAGRHTVTEVLLGAAIGMAVAWWYVRWR